jgi:hypothetical protein
MKLGEEKVLSSRESFSKCIIVRMSGQTKERGEGGFYSPQGILPVGALRDLNMSGSGAGHVWPTSLESGWWTRYAWSGDLAAEESS